MNFTKYIDTMPIGDVNDTNVTIKDYYDIIEICFDAYSIEEIISWLPKEYGGPIDDLQTFSRITGALGVLLSIGRKNELKELWYKLMDACVLTFYKERPYTTLDFAVKEFMFAYRAMKKYVPKEKKEFWDKHLRKINPFLCYYCSVDNKNCAVYGNWGMYNMAGEYLREVEGLTDTTSYFEVHMPIQLQLFDQNGMYKDPHNPILYDTATRSNLQLILGNGYEGPFKDELDNNLQKAGIYSLFMQSASFEFPYGGRSNQYVFNETYVASIYEYEAMRYKKLGNLQLAGMFKRAARLSILSIKRWIKDLDYPRHIKNFFGKDSKYGTESYGYYKKYMMSCGSFMYIACQFCDDDIKEVITPAELGGYIIKTSTDFHKLFANCQSYSIEIDLKADFIYDSTGLGRVHKAGISTELGLSTPMSATHRYTTTEGLLDKNISYCAGSKNDFLCDYSHELTSIVYNQKASIYKVSFFVKYFDLTFTNYTSIEEQYTMTKDGITIISRLVGSKTDTIYYMLPILAYNGKDYTNIVTTSHSIKVNNKKEELVITTDGTIIKEKGLYGNRNGHYHLYYAIKIGDVITINIKLR